MPPRVVIAAGGTAGHVVPALAVADALRDSGARVSFLGARGRAEEELVPAAGYEIDLLAVQGLDRRNPVRAARAAVMSVRATVAARRSLRARGAQVVLGGGGYVAAPAGLAAISLRRPLVLTEADSRLGLANRLLGPYARRVCLAFPIPGRSGRRYMVTGRPVPASIGRADRRAARERFGIAPGDRCLLVFGGSQGARSINLAALEAFGKGPTAARGGRGAGGNAAATAGRRDYHVLHIAGHRDFTDIQHRLRGDAPADRYTLVAYEPGLADTLAACDLVLARAGGSVFEIAAAGRPAILVPYPHAAGRHQHANAEWMTSAGAAVKLEDHELGGERLRTLVGGLLGDPDRLARMSAASASLARPEAATLVARELLEAAEPARAGSDRQPAAG